MKSVYIVESSSSNSTGRGVGRYVSLLKQSLPSLISVSDYTSIPRDSLLIEPFFNLIGRVSWNLLNSASKQITVIHDLIPLKYPDAFPLGFWGRIRATINTFLARRVPIVVTDSHVSQRDISKICHIDTKNIKVIYPYVSETLKLNAPIESAIFETLHIQKGSYYIYVGDVNWNKNIVTMAKAFLQTSATLVCVGKSFMTDESNLSHPWQTELNEFLKLTKGSAQIVLASHVSDADLAQLYKHAYYNVLLSRDEGFGFSYVEAGVLGTPSILASTPIFHEIAQGKGCVYVDPQSSEEIAKVINNLQKGAKARNEKGAEAAARAQTFSQLAFTEAWSTLIG